VISDSLEEAPHIFPGKIGKFGSDQLSGQTLTQQLQNPNEPLTIKCVS
jgi:hypothetical protein